MTNPTLKSNFWLGHKGKAKVNLSLTEDDLNVELSKTLCFPRKAEISIPIQYILAVHLTSSSTSNRSSPDSGGMTNEAFNSNRSYEAIPTSPPPNNSSGRHLDCMTIHYAKQEMKTVSKWRWKKLVLRQMTDSDSSDVMVKWKQTLVNAIRPYSAQRPKRLLVFINPYGGLGEAKHIFKHKVVPLFSATGVEYEVIETERANHAMEHMRDCAIARLNGFDGVICVGGDGIFNEIFTGLLRRSLESDVAEQSTSKSREHFGSNIRIGVIPAGSTDAVALSIHGSNNVESAAMHVVLGDERKIDVASVHLGENLERFSMTMASYGYFGDLLALSEKNRWMGPKRYDLAGFQTFWKNKGYEGETY